MIYGNLIKELKLRDITFNDVAHTIKKSRHSVRNKMYGDSPLYISEAFEIRDKFFPDMSLDYLFLEEVPSNQNDTH